MSVPLEGIWEAPLENEQEPAKETRRRPQAIDAAEVEVDDDEDSIFRPSRHTRSTLFLDEADEDVEANDVQRNSSRPEDIDALFADLEDIDQAASTNGPAQDSTARSFKPFDLAALRREAQEKIERDAPPSSSPSRKYVVQSSSPPPDDFGREKDSSGGDKLGGARRIKAKLDESRLLDTDGFPRLIQLCKDFKPKGKGHELSDLNHLFSMYQFWTHNMFPVTQFSDTVNKIEKLCHSKRMNVALSVWRDEVHGTINGKNVVSDMDIDVRSDKEDGSADEEIGKNGISGQSVVNNSSIALPSRASSRASSVVAGPPISHAPSSDSGNEMSVEEDPFDMEEFLAQRQKDAGSRKIANTLKTKGGNAVRDSTINDVDESVAWAGADAEVQDKHPELAAVNLAMGEPVDEEGWAVLDQIEAAATKSDNAEKPMSSPDNTHHHAVVSSENVSQHATSLDGKADKAADVMVDDDDWSDMYV